MKKTNNCNLIEDETLAEVVKRNFSEYEAIGRCQFEVSCIHFVKETNLTLYWHITALRQILSTKLYR